MLDLFAQTYNYTTTTSSELDEGAVAGILAFFAAYVVVVLIFAVIMIISMWKIFEKAGVEGWKAIIPVYNGWVLAEISGKPGWWGVVQVGGVIPFIGLIFSLAGFVLYILIAIELAKTFAKSGGFAALLILLPFVGFPMLAFGDAKYTKPKMAKQMAK